MAVIRWRERGIGGSVLLLAFLCCVSVSHGRDVGPGLDLASPSATEGREFQLAGTGLDSEFDGIIVTASVRGDVEVRVVHSLSLSLSVLRPRALPLFWRV